MAVANYIHETPIYRRFLPFHPLVEHSPSFAFTVCTGDKYENYAFDMYVTKLAALGLLLPLQIFDPLLERVCPDDYRTPIELAQRNKLLSGISSLESST